MESASNHLVHLTSHSTTETPKRAIFDLKSKEKSRFSPLVFIPNVSINPNYLAFYDVPANGRTGRTAAQVEAERFLRENDPNGQISKKASGRINQIVSWFTSLAKEKRSEYEKKVVHYRLTFVTLTLCSTQVHSDEEIKRNMLNRFLITIQREFSASNYFWRAEAQENGNIHFHVLLDAFIHYAEIRRIWNQILSDNGYLSAYQSKMKEFFKDGFKLIPGDRRSKEKQFAAYEKNLSIGFSDPNSTDVHGLKLVKNIAAYVSKYVSKNNRYYEVFSNNNEMTAAQIKKVKGVFDCKIRKGNIQFCLKNSDENKDLNIRELLESNLVQFVRVREKKIRDITGRLWGASDTVKSLKNISYEVTSDVYEAIKFIVDNGRGKWIKVSDYCRLYCLDLFNVQWPDEETAGLFEKLLPDLKLQQSLLCAN